MLSITDMVSACDTYLIVCMDAFSPSWEAFKRIVVEVNCPALIYVSQLTKSQ